MVLATNTPIPGEELAAHRAPAAAGARAVHRRAASRQPELPVEPHGVIYGGHLHVRLPSTTPRGLQGSEQEVKSEA